MGRAAIRKTVILLLLALLFSAFGGCYEVWEESTPTSDRENQPSNNKQTDDEIDLTGLSDADLTSKLQKAMTHGEVVFTGSMTASQFNMILSAIPASGGGVTLDLSGATMSGGIAAISSAAKIKEIKLPRGITSVPDSFLRSNGNVTSVTIPNSVTSVGSYAFNDCSSLSSITIPGSVISVGDHAFMNCGRLHNIAIHGSITTVGDCAFQGWDATQTITINWTTKPARWSARWYEGCNAKVQKADGTAVRIDSNTGEII